ncbi:hypothetical protein F5X68DRAFT_46500 [Plectosphaerella plurivora]|uniref:Life-span regulatory factor n=1 Tax=Plectosphaerella plurivora TaxID=936078 RepID=A0A9P8VK77_9PEZI|nr:hypothetical protein F5X68DRAFT_46500 [Plectosphaerella plurivora]
MHHQRRKSGHGSANTSMTDVRKAVTATDPSRYKRPSMNRRTTPVSTQKPGRKTRDRERDAQDAWADERESFPQFCMTCEKQFIPHDEASLYCSETCRMYDHSPTGFDGHSGAGSYLSNAHPIYASEYSEPRDIIPRASPSRPSSHYYSTSAGLEEPTSPYHSSAMSALRSLTVHPPSPPSPTGPQSSLWPFSKSAATSPAGSYNKGGNSGFFPSTYDGYSGYYNYTNGMDRPLPTRNPSGYSRPKSIELVTPLIGR